MEILAGWALQWHLWFSKPFKRGKLNAVAGLLCTVQSDLSNDTRMMKGLCFGSIRAGVHKCSPLCIYVSVIMYWKDKTYIWVGDV